jgi:D-lactate dehydrogenase
MNIAFFELNEEEGNAFKKELKGNQVSFFNEILNNGNVSKAKDCEILSVFIASKVSREILDSLPNLKLVVTRSTGFDHIDLEECKKRKIRVCNVPTYGENSVAEHAFALLLSISRNVHKAYLRCLTDDYDIHGLKGWDLQDKTIGVLGTGHIGQHVIRMAKGFGMNVLAYDLYQNKPLQKKLGFKYAKLDEVLKKSDVITLHLPYNNGTHHIIDEKMISKMKDGVIIINTARGGLIDTHALLKAIENKKIGGAGLDVIECEEIIHEDKSHLPKNRMELKKRIDEYRLLKNENVVFTPHIAFFSQEALGRIHHTSLENIQMFLKKKLQNSVV